MEFSTYNFYNTLVNSINVIQSNVIIPYELVSLLASQLKKDIVQTKFLSRQATDISSVNLQFQNPTSVGAAIKGTKDTLKFVQYKDPDCPCLKSLYGTNCWTCCV